MMVTSLLTIGANNSLRIGLFQLSIGHAAWSIRESTWSKSSGIFIHLVSLPLFNLTKLYPKKHDFLKNTSKSKRRLSVDLELVGTNWLRKGKRQQEFQSTSQLTANAKNFIMEKGCIK